MNKFYNTYIGIILTYQCNLNCSYCYIPKKKNISMSLEIAQMILKPYLSLDDADPIEIDFMGAEPLSAFVRMKEIVEWVKTQHFKRKYFFFATTNGTLLNEDMKPWFVKNKDTIILGLSYDGTDDSQNKNRSESSQRIDISFFLSTWPNQAIKCTISEKSVYELSDGIVRFSEMGANVIANPAYEDAEWSKDSIEEYSRQLHKIICYYSRTPNAPIASLVDHDLIGIYYRNDLEQGPNCGAVQGEGIYDISGHSYPCQMLSPLVMSEEKALTIQNIIKKNDVSCYNDKKCNNCILRNDCPTCMATNYRIRNSFSQRDSTHCQLTKLEVLATCVLQKTLLLQKKEPLNGKDAVLAKAICHIYNSLFVNQKN